MRVKYEELIQEIKEIMENDPCVCMTGFIERSLLYKEEFENIRNELTADDKKWNGLGFTVALSENSLWATLALIFDEYALKAIHKSMTVENKLKTINSAEAYADFVRQKTSDVAKFKQDYPLLNYTIGKASQNFKNNLDKCCQRLSLDILDIEKVFNKKFSFLKKIRCSGNDFHKGGAQVLFLTFECNSGEDFKLVYKPSDLELDFRITAKTTNPYLRKLMKLKDSEQSFLEILNQEMEVRIGETDIFPALPIYTIYPVKRASKESNIKKAIEESYGYCEFLEYTNEGYIEEKKARESFYHLLGKLLAVARCLSIHDFHQENLIVHGNKPCLIDLEASLMGENLNIKNTCAELLIQENTSATHYFTLVIDNSGCEFERKTHVSPTLNVLRNRDFSPVSIKGYLKNIYYGYYTTLAAIRSLSGIKKRKLIILPWLESVSHCLARHVPMKTSDYYNWLDSIYSYNNFHKTIAKIKEGFTEEETKKNIRKQWDKYLKGHITKFDHFLTYRHMFTDFYNLDIPSFYGFPYRTLLFDARGEEVSFEGVIQSPPRIHYFEKEPIRYIVGQISTGNLDNWIKKANADIVEVLPKSGEIVKVITGELILKKGE